MSNRLSIRANGRCGLGFEWSAFDHGLGAFARSTAMVPACAIAHERDDAP